MHLFDHDISNFTGVGLPLEGSITPNWSINGNPHGGYLMAVLASAVFGQSHYPHLKILTANFISRCSPGEAQIHLEHVGASTQFDRWQASLLQGGEEKIRALATLMKEDENTAEKYYEHSPPEVPSIDTCVAFPQMPRYTFFDQMEVRLAPDCAGWMTGDLGGKSELRGWVRFRENRPFDMLGVLLAADAFPPAIFPRQGMAAWVPTLELSVNIRNPATTPWLKCVFCSSYLNNGMVEEDGTVWDESGELIAISRQIAQFRK
ncbi:MAG: thioesterase family protein [Desulfatiglandaceae bacterium]